LNTIFILLDSLNRHLLSSYARSEVITPNIERLAKRGIVFDNHYSGSLPCMPARREMMTGRYNFLEAPWGPIQPWDNCLPTILRERAGTYSHLITDDYHYFHSGGEGFHTLFDSYELERGQEGDTWRPLVEPLAGPLRPADKRAHARFYAANRAFMDPEADESYPTPRCFMRAIDFVEHNHSSDNWHLQLELFDPHEPFDCPTRYRDLYGDVWGGELYTWPEYLPLETDRDDPESIAHIQKCYAATLTMADTWLGRLLDKLDEYDLWKGTTIVLTTDHGYLLGEHGYWAKNFMFDYREVVHIPLIICAPSSIAPAGRESAITTTIDLAPTFLELHGVPALHSMQGRSITSLMKAPGENDLHALHDAVLYGYFGKDIGLFDGRYTYCRQPLPGSVTHHHTAMPRLFKGFVDRAALAAAEIGTFLSDCDGIPHYRIPVPSHRHHNAPDFNPIYDITMDPGQERPLRDTAVEEMLADKMRSVLERYDAPGCQFIRTGLRPQGGR